MVYSVYQVCTELNIPVMIHCGMSWAMAGLEKYAHPLQLEELAIDFPDLSIIVPHFGWPWIYETLMIAMKYKNVYIDTSIVYSGTPKEVLQHVLAEQIGIHVLERSIPEQIVFGSNYPRADIRRTVRGIRALGMSSSLQARILHKNASKLLGLGSENI